MSDRPHAHKSNNITCSLQHTAVTAARCRRRRRPGAARWHSSRPIGTELVSAVPLSDMLAALTLHFRFKTLLNLARAFALEGKNNGACNRRRIQVCHPRTHLKILTCTLSSMFGFHRGRFKFIVLKVNPLPVSQSICYRCVQTSIHNIG